MRPKSVRFERCTFTQLGGAGLDIEFGSQDNVVAGCRFCDISGTAVQVGDVLKDDHHPDDPRKIVKNNAVVNNYIHDCGVDYWGSVGVFAGYTEGTVIAHNEIASLPYSGISVGWGWGEEDAGGGNPDYQQPFKYDTPTPAKNNRIECNNIHGAMSKTDDGGGIYMLGNQPGTVIRGNHVHDCRIPRALATGPPASIWTRAAGSSKSRATSYTTCRFRPTTTTRSRTGWPPARIATTSSAAIRTRRNPSSTTPAWIRSIETC